MEILKYRVNASSEWQDIIAIKGDKGDKGDAYILTEEDKTVIKNEIIQEANIDDLIQEVEDCYNNMLTNEVEGTSIHIEDSANARVLELDIDGNSYQETGENMPSPDYPSEVQTIKGNISVVVAGNNFFNDENLVTKDCTYINNNHSLTVTATYSYAYIQQKVENLVLGQTYHYYHSGDNATWIVVKDSNGAKIAEAYASKSISYTAPNDGVVTISIYATTSSTSGTKIFTNLTVSTEKNLPYEEYHKNISYIDLQDNELCKIGDIKDELDLTTGILTKRIGKVVLDGSENWTSLTSSTGANNIQVSIMKHTSTPMDIYYDAINDYFVYEKISRPKTHGTFNVLASGTNLFVRVNFNNSTDVDSFKTWVSENPVTVYYVLENSYEVNLGKIERPKTFNHVTNINLLATLETNMKLKYVRSTNVVVDNLAKAIVALGGEV